MKLNWSFQRGKGSLEKKNPYKPLLWGQYYLELHIATLTSLF